MDQLCPACNIESAQTIKVNVFLRAELLMIQGMLGRNREKKICSPSSEEKKSSAGWPGKKAHREFSARAPPPDHE